MSLSGIFIWCDHLIFPSEATSGMCHDSSLRLIGVVACVVSVDSTWCPGRRLVPCRPFPDTTSEHSCRIPGANSDSSAALLSASCAVSNNSSCRSWGVADPCRCLRFLKSLPGDFHEQPSSLLPSSNVPPYFRGQQLSAASLPPSSSPLGFPLSLVWVSCELPASF